MASNSLKTPKPSARHKNILLKTIATITALLCSLFAGLSARQFQLRWKIERTIKAIYALEERQTSAEDVQRTLVAIGVETKPDCTNDVCVFHFHISAFSGGMLSRGIFARPAIRALQGVGIRPVLFQGDVVLKDGHTSSSMGLFVGYAPNLLAGYRMTTAIQFYSNHPGLDPRQSFLIRHPHVTSLEGGDAIEVVIAPDATVGEKRIARNFDLHCITQWGNCDSADDLMPAAAARSRSGLR